MKIIYNLFFFSFTVSCLAYSIYDSKKCGIASSYRKFKMKDNKGKLRTVVNEAPWAVQLDININVDDNGRKIRSVTCGGTLISKRHVITAAHCFRKKLSKKTSVIADRYCDKNSDLTINEIISGTKIRVGAVCTEINKDLGCTEKGLLGSVLNVTRVYVSDFYKKNCNQGDDMVLLELSKSIESIDGANHACLPFLHNIKLPNSQTTFTSFGWGADPGHAYDNKPYPLLQIIDIESISKDDCNDLLGEEAPYDTICTAEEAEKNVCRGDSGGGIMYKPKNDIKNYAVGIISFGSDCSAMLLGAEPKAQVNTDILSHEKAIREFIKI